jgi:hypothetical protein
MKCPNCKKEQHYVCSNKKCVCYTRIPNGEKHLIYRPMFRKIIIYKWLFNFMWHTLKNPMKVGFYELEECPYCGYSDFLDNWVDNDMEEKYPNGISDEEAIA